MLAPYAASKAFLASFNAALAEEVKGKGIDVECTNTYFVVRIIIDSALSTRWCSRIALQVSNLSKIRRPSMTTPTPKAYVRSVLSKVGLPCGALWTGRPYVVTPYWSHAVIDWFMVRIIPTTGSLSLRLTSVRPSECIGLESAVRTLHA